MQTLTRFFSSRWLTALFAILFITSTLTACKGNSTSSTEANSNSSRSVTDAGNSSGQNSNGNSNGSSNETPAITPYERKEDYPGIVTLPLQFISTSSGKKMGVLVTLPADEKGEPINSAFPAVLVQTAYNINAISGLNGKMPQGVSALVGAPDPFIVKRGYAMVTVDAVGTGVSDGGWEMLGEEEQSGYADALDWVLKQSWSNGKIGVAGASYMAITALFTAESRPDAVQAIFASVPMGDAYRGTVSTGGMINGLFMSTWLTTTALLTKQNSAVAAKYPEYKDQIDAATKEHIAQIDNYYLPVINKALTGDPEITYDSQFWRTRSPIAKIDNIKAPTMILGALNDIFQRDEPLLYEQLKKNVDTRLIIYDGDHVSNFLQQYAGNDKVAPAPNLMLQWFDKYLKGINSGIEKIPPVTQYVKGRSDSNERKAFASTTDWPHPLATAERWYLHGDKSLTKIAPVDDEETHSLTTPPFADIVAKKSAGGTALDFKVSPKDGTRCSISFRQWTLGGASAANPARCYADSTELEANALNFETAPFEKDYYINGPIQADIWIDSTTTEAVVSVRIDEVASDGSFVKP
ncbi:MAG TPA: CocE/NonD family hydrolase, partial [Pseudomonadales bacterium]|nr:CocE/NonD family hydrolase [Pseudomonadales bacterium]